MKNSNQSRVNAYIMALYIFQFGFLQPIASIFNSQAPIALFTIVLVLIALVYNRFRLKLYAMLLLIISTVFFLVSIIALSTAEVGLIFVEFLAKGVSAFFIASLPTDSEELYHSCLVLAVVNFFAIGLYPFVKFLDSMNYMRFGYAMLPSVIMFAYAVFDVRKRNIFWFLAFICSVSLMLVFGARGTIVALALFPTFIFVSSKTISAKKKVLLLLVTTTFVFIILRFDMLVRVLDYLYYDLGIQTYSLAKLRMMLVQGLAVASSGRDAIYGRLGALFMDSPVIGHGVGIVQRSWGLTAHNVFLQILVESGIIGLLLWSLVWVFCLVEYVKIDQSNKSGFYRIVTMLGAISVGRLMVSSDMWLRPEYWFFISMLISSALTRKRCEKSRNSYVVIPSNDYLSQKC